MSRKCEFCGADIVNGQMVAKVPMSDGAELAVLISASICSDCGEDCYIETELACG